MLVSFGGTPNGMKRGPTSEEGHSSGRDEEESGMDKEDDLEPHDRSAIRQRAGSLHR